MTLGRLILAWLVVAAWFYVATWLTALIPPLMMRIPREPAWVVNIPLWLIRWRPIEAAGVTLLASLWFDSLGTGGWWLIFGLVGLLATVPPLFLNTADVTPRRPTLIAVGVAELLRYIVGGALLAWRLA